MFIRNRRYRRSLSRETTFSSVPDHVFEETHSEGLGKRAMEKLRKEIHDLCLKILEQEEELKTKQDTVALRRDVARSEVQSLFSELKDILIKKESECLAKIDDSFRDIDEKLSETVDSIGCTRKLIEDVLDLEDGVSVDVVSTIHRDVNSGVEEQDQLIERIKIPQVTVNSNLLSDIEAFNLLTVETEAETGVDAASGTENNGSGTGADGNDRPYVGGSNRVSRENGGRLQIGSEGSMDGVEAEGAVGFFNRSITVPIPVPSRSEPPPPPYWQAVGLPGPAFSGSGSSVTTTDSVPGYADIGTTSQLVALSDKLEFWNCFPIRRQHDGKSPMIVSIAWNHQRLCVADRANKKIKFFYHSGHLITEMCFGDCEIYDVAFLEEDHGEARYIATIPKTNALLIISIENDHTTNLLSKIVLKQRYTSICRGPRDQTLVGANALPKDGLPRIDIFNFSGEVLQTFTHTPKFACFVYPKSVAVFENAVIVSDWKLNIVAVFLEDGTKVGQYKGTPSTPLVKPLDLTLDQHGNIMIVDGQFSNIHVIDLICNPIKIIKVPRGGIETSKPKLAAFDWETNRLAVIRSTGDLAIFTFRNGCNMRSEELPQLNSYGSPTSPRTPEVFPFSEPSMAETYGARPRTRFQPTFIL